MNALVASVISLVTLAWTLVSFFLTRGRLSSFERRTLEQQHETAIRERHRLQLNDAIGYVLGESTLSQEIGVKMLHSLNDAEWPVHEDRVKVASLIDLIVEV